VTPADALEEARDTIPLVRTFRACCILRIVSATLLTVGGHLKGGMMTICSRRNLVQGLLAAATLLAALQGSTSTAGASWANKHCKADLPHCYAITFWDPAAAREVGKVWTYIDTESMYVPYSETEKEQGHIDDETWVKPGPGYYPWIEGGQITIQERNSHSQMYGFWAWYLSETDFNVEISPSVGVADEPDRKNLYQFYDREYIGDGHGEIWCAVWESALFGCQSGIGEPARDLESGAEVATETTPYNYGSTEPYAIGGTGNRWRGPNAEAEKFTEEGTCGHLEGSKPVKSFVFGAGHECGFDAVLEEQMPSAEVPTAVEPYEDYVQGTPTIDAAQARAKALSQAASDGDSAATVASVTSGTLLGTAELVDPAMSAVRESMVGKSGLTAYEESPVYRVVLLGANVDSFSWNLPVSRGAPAPHGNRLELVYDMATGWMVRTHIWYEPASTG
jgi:hypothetical protein